MRLPKAYSAKKYEEKIYRAWERSGLFTPKIIKGKKPFVISMPPPNATGTLHLGHAVMLALEDIMTRYHRMKGDPSLWLPGTDHASIATQNKVEKLLAEEGLTRHMLGREKFLKRVHEFVEKSRDTIKKQIRKMGSSCDWSRERYTLDPMLSTAVREVFVRMHADGLIYIGKRVVNWCPRCKSTLADDEVDYSEKTTKLYVFKYDENFPFEIATTRPETKLGDVAVAVHPDDKRYQQFLKQTYTVSFAGTGRTNNIYVFADKSVDSAFGTGAVGITPAHSKTDEELVQKHKVLFVPVDVIDENGQIKEFGGYSGMDVNSARGKIVDYLKEHNLLNESKTQDIVHNLACCYRCGATVEQLRSKQWFINVDKKFGKRQKSLKQLSIEVVKTGSIKILPQRFEKTYFHWMENLHDWCVSRQIWFGHQIPVWYCENENCPKYEEPIVAANTPKKCPHCGWTKLRQDPDTLDTWFSSGLWTFSTLGWPAKTKDLQYFHPTSVLETGYDILFFWIARMIIMTQYALNDIPFKYVYLHGLVRTREGKKMSKSDPKTCIDPLDMIKKYGADALRLSMVIGSTPGNDIRLYEEKIAGFRNFVNKIWNAARFISLQIGDAKKTRNRAVKAASSADKWILTRIQQTIDEVTADIENFSFSEAGMKIYNFLWGEFCDWYLEISKGRGKNIGILKYGIETMLKLLHPFVPFVTEALWGILRQKTLLIDEKWPSADKKLIFKNEAEAMSVIIEAISAIRNLRHESGISPSAKIHAVLASGKWKNLLEEKREPIMRLAKIEQLEIAEQAPRMSPSLAEYTRSGVEILLPMKDLSHVSAEKKRLNEEKESLGRYVQSVRQKLLNENFTNKAPAEIVEAERIKLASAEEKLAKTEQRLKMLG